MISNAFKSAYTNQIAQQNQGINTISNGVKDAALAIIGGTAIAGKLGSGALAQASGHALAGRVGGIGGNIMLATLMERKQSIIESKQSKEVFSKEEIGSAIDDLKNNPINNTAVKQLNTVFDTLTQSKSQGIINKRGSIESSIGDIDPNSELGKRIIKEGGNDTDK